MQRTNANGSYFVPDNVGIGIMMYGSGNNNGGYVRFGVRKMTAANRAALIELLKNMPVGDKGSSQQDFGWMMWEAFKYFGGGIGEPRGRRRPGVRSRRTVSARAPTSAITRVTARPGPRSRLAPMSTYALHLVVDRQ